MKRYKALIVFCCVMLLFSPLFFSDPSPLALAVNHIGKTLPPNAAPLEQQVFRFMFSEPTSLDIGLVVYGANGTQFLFERLVMLNENNELVPAAASRWETNRTGDRWTFHLRPDGRWSDGRPVTAHDFEYAFKRFLDPKNGNPFAYFYYEIKGAKAFNQSLTTDPASVGIRAQDNLTLIIETERACPYLPYIVAFGTSAPVPRWQVERFGAKWTEPEHCVSNSSYRLTAWAHGASLTFGLNEQYAGPHKSTLEQIRILFSDATHSALAAYENNETDWIFLDAPDLARVRDDPVLKKELAIEPYPATWYLFFRTEQAPFNDVRVRQAISHAIDREAICRVALQGLGLPAYSMIPPGLPGYAGDRLRPLQAFDPTIARQLLAEAGYPGGRGFPKTELWLRNAPASLRTVAEALQAMLKDQLGIDVTIQLTERKLYTEKMLQRTLPLSLITYSSDFPDPGNMLAQVWHSQPEGSGRHDWKNERFDQLVDQASGEMNPSKRLELYQEAERLLISDAGGVFLLHPKFAELRKAWVRGISRNARGDDPLDLQTTAITKVYVGK